MNIFKITKGGEDKGFIKTNLYSYHLKEILEEYLLDNNNNLDIEDFIEYVQIINDEIYIERFHIDEIIDL